MTNGFSARYGQALSGLVNVVTREPRRDAGRAGSPTRATGRSAAGSIAGSTGSRFARGGPARRAASGLVAAFDVAGPAGRRSGERAGAGRTRAIPAPRRRTLCPTTAASSGPAPPSWWCRSPSGATFRALGLHSEDQRLLYDPAYKYDPEFGPAQRLRGRPGERAHAVHQRSPRRGMPLVLDLRAGRYVREFVRGELVEQPDYAFGALTGSRFHFVGEDLARAQSTVARPDPGTARAGRRASATPWGVPAFFQGGGSRGELALEPVRRDSVPARRHDRRDAGPGSVRRRRVRRRSRCAPISARSASCRSATLCRPPARSAFSPAQRRGVRRRRRCGSRTSR